MELVVFIGAAIMILAGALGVVTRSNPVHAALSMVLSLFGIAVLFVAQSAHCFYDTNRSTIKRKASLSGNNFQNGTNVSVLILEWVMNPRIQIVFELAKRLNIDVGKKVAQTTKKK